MIKVAEIIVTDAVRSGVFTTNAIATTPARVGAIAQMKINSLRRMPPTHN